MALPDDIAYRTLSRPNESTKEVRRWHDPKRHSYHSVTTLDKVPEGHLYLRNASSAGAELVWEADLLGDLSPDEGHGKIPPMIHIECPFCTSVEDRRALSITLGNKTFEIEELQEPELVNINSLHGPMQLPIKFLLSIREPITCTFPGCGTRFLIRGGRFYKD